jgi:hypothetical protein
MTPGRRARGFHQSVDTRYQWGMCRQQAGPRRRNGPRKFTDSPAEVHDQGVLERFVTRLIERD